MEENNESGEAVEQIIGAATTPEESRLLQMLALMYLELVEIKMVLTEAPE
jgi:hypothetical protein